MSNEAWAGGSTEERSVRTRLAGAGAAGLGTAGARLVGGGVLGAGLVREGSAADDSVGVESAGPGSAGGGSAGTGLAGAGSAGAGLAGAGLVGAGLAGGVVGDERVREGSAASLSAGSERVGSERAGSERAGSERVGSKSGGGGAVGDGGVGDGLGLPWRSCIQIALLPWLVTRVLTFSTLVVVRASGSEGIPTGTGFLDGLLHWDGQWYARIAEHGYQAAGAESFRFFPLLPLLGRLFGSGIGADVGVVIVANLASLVALAVIVRLVTSEGRSPRFGMLSVWVVALAPHAFVSAMGYAEPLFLFLSTLSIYLYRRQAWWASMLSGYLVGLTRPFGVLVMVPAAVEAGSGFFASDGSGRLARVGAVAAPFAGLATFLVWCANAAGDAFAPFTVQQGEEFRGGFVVPVWRIITGVGDAVGGSGITAAHLVWLAVFVVATIDVFKRWPVSFGAFALVVLLTATSSDNLDGLERYLWSVIPIPLGVADVLAGFPRVLRRGVFVASVAALVVYAGLAFDGRLVP